MIIKFKWRGRIALMLLVVVSFVLSNCNETSNKNVSNNGKGNLHVDTVIIKQMQFSPATLNITKGDTVVWINKDLVDHDITSDASKLFYSDTLKVGKSWKYKMMDSASYHCSIHPSMKGQIILK